jgi:uncharacterized RDD family membrane protein YckC
VRLPDPTDVRPRGLPLPHGTDRLPTWVGPFVSALSFWGAIVLPVCYLSLLLVGIEDTTGLLVFLGLFGLHVLTLIAGQSYRPNGSPGVDGSRGSDSSR